MIMIIAGVFRRICILFDDYDATNDKAVIRILAEDAGDDYYQSSRKRLLIKFINRLHRVQPVNEQKRTFTIMGCFVPRLY